MRRGATIFAPCMVHTLCNSLPFHGIRRDSIARPAHPVRGGYATAPAMRRPKAENRKLKTSLPENTKFLAPDATFTFGRKRGDRSQETGHMSEDASFRHGANRSASCLISFNTRPVIAEAGRPLVGRHLPYHGFPSAFCHRPENLPQRLQSARRQEEDCRKSTKNAKTGKAHSCLSLRAAAGASSSLHFSKFTIRYFPTPAGLREQCRPHYPAWGTSITLEIAATAETLANPHFHR
jgi:hypothetical protein